MLILTHATAYVKPKRPAHTDTHIHTCMHTQTSKHTYQFTCTETLTGANENPYKTIRKWGIRTKSTRNYAKRNLSNKWFICCLQAHLDVETNVGYWYEFARQRRSVCIWEYTLTHICIPISQMHMYTYVYSSVYLTIYVPMYICVYVCMGAWICIYMYIHIRIYSYVYIYMYIHMEFDEVVCLWQIWDPVVPLQHIFRIRFIYFHEPE